MKKTTIKDIAQEAGVSATTVSRYVNGSYSNMSEETRKKIENIINKTGYRPNNVARSLRSNASRIIGVIISDIHNPFFAAILGSMNHEAIRTDYSLYISFSNNSSSAETTLIQKMNDNGIDALLINTVGGNETLIEEMGQRIPVILLDRNIEHSLLPIITSNNRDLMKKLLVHLKEQTYDNVVLLSESPHTSSVRQLRIRAFQEIATELKLNQRTVIISQNDFHESYSSALRIDDLILKEERTAVIAINGKVLNYILSISMNSAFQFGKDFGLVSFDDSLLNSLMGITTATQDTTEMGRRAFYMIKSKLEEKNFCPPKEKEEIIISGKLILRSTT